MNDQERIAYAEQIKARIDKYIVDTYSEGHRNHLGSSIIGKACERQIWYIFRWCKKESFSARMLRLFNRGHKEELRFAEWLTGAGFKLITHDDNGKQIRMKGYKGHYAGSTDGLGFDLVTNNGIKFIVEGKTHNTGAGFNDLCAMGVKHKHPEHYNQMCSYGAKFDAHFGIYLSINKNDDSLHVEVVALDWSVADQDDKKAARIIDATYPPVRISESPAFWQCKTCTFVFVCHMKEAVEINCRSCRNAIAIDNGEWFCKLFNDKIPADFIPKGCEQHKGF